jgi:hypothetical protein
VHSHVQRHDNQFVMIGLSLVPGPVWPVARCCVGLGPRHGPKSLAGNTRNASQITCSTRCHLPPWKRSAKSP